MQMNIKEIWWDENDLIISNDEETIRLVNAYPTSLIFEDFESSEEAVITLERTWQSQ